MLVTPVVVLHYDLLLSLVHVQSLSQPIFLWRSLELLLTLRVLNGKRVSVVANHEVLLCVEVSRRQLPIPSSFIARLAYPQLYPVVALNHVPFHSSFLVVYVNLSKVGIEFSLDQLVKCKHPVIALAETLVESKRDNHYQRGSQGAVSS